MIYLIFKNIYIYNILIKFLSIKIENLNNIIQIKIYYYKIFIKYQYLIFFYKIFKYKSKNI